MACLAGTLLVLALAQNPYLVSGRARYQALHYAEAEPELKLACSAPTSTDGEKREACDLWARTLAALGRTEEAENAYAALLADDPAAPAPTRTSPKIVDLFEAAKHRLYPQDYVALHKEPSPPSRIIVRIDDPWGWVEQLAVIPLQPAGAEIPLAVVRREASADLPVEHAGLSFRVVARDRRGRELASLGSVEAPLYAEGEREPAAPDVTTLPAPREEAGELQREAPEVSHAPAIGTAVAAGVLIVAGVVLEALARSDSSSAGTAPFASDTAQLDSRARSEAIAADVVLGAGLAAGAVAGGLFWSER